MKSAVPPTLLGHRTLVVLDCRHRYHPADNIGVPLLIPRRNWHRHRRKSIKNGRIIVCDVIHANRPDTGLSNNRISLTTEVSSL